MDPQLYRSVRNGLKLVKKRLTTPKISKSKTGVSTVYKWSQDNADIILFQGHVTNKNVMKDHLIEIIDHPLNVSIHNLSIMVVDDDLIFKGMIKVYVFDKHQTGFMLTGGREYDAVFLTSDDVNENGIVLNIFDNIQDAKNFYNNINVGYNLIETRFNANLTTIVGVVDTIRTMFDAQTRVPSPTKSKIPSPDWSRRAAAAAGGKGNKSRK